MEQQDWEYWTDEEIQQLMEESYVESEFSMDEYDIFDDMDDEEDSYDELENELHAKADRKRKKDTNMPMDGRGLIVNNINRKYRKERRSKNDGDF